MPELSFAMSETTSEMIQAKRGSLRVFRHHVAATSVLLVVDMQRYYTDRSPSVAAIVQNVNRLANGVRARGGRVFWVQMMAGREGQSMWPFYHEHFFTPERAAHHRDSLSPGAPGFELASGLEVAPADTRFVKTRFSAFTGGNPDLNTHLKRLDVESVFVCGTSTNFCCEATARDAMRLDYRVTIVADACAAGSEENHNAALNNVAQNFGDVLSVDEVLGCFGAGASGGRL